GARRAPCRHGVHGVAIHLLTGSGYRPVESAGQPGHLCPALPPSCGINARWAQANLPLPPDRRAPNLRVARSVPKEEGGPLRRGSLPLNLVAQRPDPALERGEVVAKACDALVLGAYEAHVGGQGRTQVLQRAVELPCELLRQGGVQALA